MRQAFTEDEIKLSVESVLSMGCPLDPHTSDMCTSCVDHIQKCYGCVFVWIVLIQLYVAHAGASHVLVIRFVHLFSKFFKAQAVANVHPFAPQLAAQ